MGKIVRNTNFKLSHACDQFIGFQFFFRSYTALIPSAFTASLRLGDKKTLLLTDIAFRALLSQSNDNRELRQIVRGSKSSHKSAKGKLYMLYIPSP